MSNSSLNPTKLKELIIESLNLEGMTPEMIEDDQPLFGEGLGLDSVDALELVVAMEKRFGFKIRSEEIDPQSFATIKNILRFLQQRMPETEGASG